MAGIHVILSGRLCAGKTSLAYALRDRRGYRVVSARDVLRQLAAKDLATRAALQVFGSDLERSSRGTWLADAVKTAQRQEPGTSIAVDAVRTVDQLTAVRAALRGDHGDQVLHIALRAAPEVLEARFQGRRQPEDATSTGLADAVAHDIERWADELEADADAVIETSHLALAGVFDEVERWLERA